ncbi:MAG: DNA mismatch repair endonuclease MutL, partial [Thermoanaerobaculia bacterium]|nr:DNA mismatch repair endonuclease MutL [Thermoanaerobaculia bacterium]
MSQIAAGEVVERPASVVKELIENSLDAGSKEIAIDLEVGGKRLIRISDDGIGMGKEDSLLAFDQHATSKIKDFDDLQRVGTLGFRGEALASIAAVAKVELLTAEAPGEGWRVRIEGSRVRQVEPAARARGTTLEIASLFFNVPARRKFLKTPPTEMRRCVEVVQGYCLACPDVTFRLRHEGRTVVDAVATSLDAEGLRQRIRQLFGESLAEALVELPAGGSSGESIRGFVGRRETSKGRRLFIFVNGRLIRDRQVLAAYYRAVREEWKHDDYPSLFLFLGVPPEDLDVNVHPQKTEVRFRDSSFVHRVSQAIRRGLREARGEEEAPLREAWGAADRPLAWSGLGRGREEGDNAIGEP